MPRPAPRPSADARRAAAPGPVPPRARCALATALGLALWACGGPEEPPAPTAEPAAAPAGDLVDEAEVRGVDYVNRSGGAEKGTILEANGAGVALLDLGGDGDLDLVFAQGLAGLEQCASGPGADLAVYENDGAGRFRRQAGPGLAGWWTGLAAGDLDADGDADLVAGGFGGLVVLLQEGDGRLHVARELVPEELRLAVGARRAGDRPPAWATSLALLDADGDGLLDLYVGQYLELDPLAPPRGAVGAGALAIPCRWKGHAVYCGPQGLVPQPDRLLRGRGDGSFEDRSADWLPETQPGYTLAVHAFDADGDRDPDLFVANDSSPNRMLVNDGSGRFVDHGFEAGLALSPDGRAEAGMGAASGDVDRDLAPDLALTNFSDEPTALYLGAALGFEDATFRYGLGRETRALLSWSVHLEDFDGDGWLELFTANGHVYPEADREHTGTRYAQPDTLWALGPEPRAARVAPRLPGSVLALARGTRGSAVGDLDGDGDPDLVLAHLDAPASVAINSLGAGNHRLELRLAAPDPRALSGPGRRTPRDAHGARAFVRVGSGAEAFTLVREVGTAVGYQSASSPALHFGLGAAARCEALAVRWPSGRVEELDGCAADRTLWIEEGRGVVREVAW